MKTIGQILQEEREKAQLRKLKLKQVNNELAKRTNKWEIKQIPKFTDEELKLVQRRYKEICHKEPDTKQ